MATGSGRRTGRKVRRAGAWLAAGAALLLLACGEPSPEAQLAEAREGLERARQEVESAKARVEETTRKLEKAQEAREEALGSLTAAREDLAEARAEVGRYATDDAIFRAVQSRLLEDEELSDVAIPVRVDDGVVTLTGEVPKRELATRAEEITNEVAGVIEVRNRIRVPASEAKRRGTGGAGARQGRAQDASGAHAGDEEATGQGPAEE
jgi:hypothetical protein